MSSRFEYFDELPERTEPQKNELSKNFKLFGYQPKEENVEKLRHQLFQKIAVPATEYTTKALGGLGDLASLVNQLAGRPIGGKEFEEIPVLGQIPTSERLHTGIEELTGKKIRPETTTEEMVSRGFAILGSLTGGGAKAMQSILGATLTPVAEKVAEEFGASDKTKAAVGALTLLATGLKGKKGLKDTYNELFDKAKSLSADKSVDVNNLVKNLDSIEQKLKLGSESAVSKQATKKLINEIYDKISNEKIPMKDLLEFKFNINEERGKLFAKDIGKAGVKMARANLNSLAHAVDKGLYEFAKESPEFGKSFKEANTLYSEAHNLPKAIKFLESKTNLAENDPLTNALILMNPGKFVEAYGAAKGGKILNYLLMRPNIRKLYVNLIGQSMKENKTAIASTIKKLDSEIRSEKENFEDPEIRFEYFDEKPD